MLRDHLLQHWIELSDPGTEKALYNSVAMHQFFSIDLGKESVPEEITICKFRTLVERSNLGNDLFRLVKVYLE